MFFSHTGEGFEADLPLRGRAFFPGREERSSPFSFPASKPCSLGETPDKMQGGRVPATETDSRSFVSADPVTPVVSDALLHCRAFFFLFHILNALAVHSSFSGLYRVLWL